MNYISLRKLVGFALVAVLAVVFGPSVASAHVGVGPVHDVLHGMEHPLTGLDHLAAMLAVGIWAAQLGGRSLWVVPLSFVSVMALGGALGMTGVHLPLVEPGIVVSLIVLGILVATATRLPLAVKRPDRGGVCPCTWIRTRCGDPIGNFRLHVCGRLYLDDCRDPRDRRWFWALYQGGTCIATTTIGWGSGCRVRVVFDRWLVFAIVLSWRHCYGYVAQAADSAWR